MTAILGISAFYHDSAAALVVDGEIVAAAQEERFTRKKHDPEFPVHAIEYCLAEAGLTPEQLDYVGFYDKPLLKFERLLETYLAFAPAGFRSFAQAMPLWLQQKLHLPREIEPRPERRATGSASSSREHHESHAASAFFPSPFEEAAILTLDGVGEWATASFGVGRGNRIELTHELRFPHSLGLLYSAFTYFSGFRVNSGEYKLMGLAPYGEPVYADLIREKLIDLKDDGSFRLDMSYFNYCQGLTMTSRKFDRLFGGPPRRPESPLTAARDGHRRVDPGGHRGDHAPLRPARPRADGHEEPLPGRRRGAQLRGQRPDPARGALREHLDPAGGRRRRRRAGRGPVHLAPVARQAAHRRAGTTASAARCWARDSATTRSGSSSMACGAQYRRFDDEDRLCAIAWPS